MSAILAGIRIRREDVEKCDTKRNRERVQEFHMAVMSGRGKEEKEAEEMRIYAAQD